MGSGTAGDLARQAANVFGAVFQAGATFAAGASIQGVVDEGPRSLVEPTSARTRAVCGCASG